jgi:nitroreductase
MDVFEAVQERRSIRAYQDTPVPREKLDLSSKLLHLMRSRKTLSEVASEETFGQHLVPQIVPDL